MIRVAEFTMANSRYAREIFLVGSIPLSNACEVFEVIADKLNGAVKRIPDGETGDRSGWLEWQEHVLRSNPLLEQVPSEGDWRNKTAPDKWRHRIWYRLKDGVVPENFNLGELGYADNAISSYLTFKEIKASGSIAPETRFLVAIPSPYNLISRYFVPDQRAAIEPAYERAILNEVDLIANSIPRQELAIQWDCARDMQTYDGEAHKPWFPDTQSGIERRLTNLGNHIPTDIELGYHFCYGSFGGRHFVEPKNMAAMVRLANALFDNVRRPINWVHMPVPIDRTDDGYFAPLDDLRLPSTTRLYLGVIHDHDGVAGTEKRIAAASRHTAGFGIATECGFGRRDPASIMSLIALHQQLASASRR